MLEWQTNRLKNPNANSRGVVYRNTLEECTTIGLTSSSACPLDFKNIRWYTFQTVLLLIGTALYRSILLDVVCACPSTIGVAYLYEKIFQA